MALKLKYTDEHGILHINMSPTSSAKDENRNEQDAEPVESKTEITDPKFDTINNRFAQYDLFGGKYDVEIGGETSRSLFRSRYNSIEEELANTPYAFATDRTVRLNSGNNNVVDIKIKSRGSDVSPSKDIEDDRFFNRNLNLKYDVFGSDVDIVSKSSVKTSDEDSPAFTVTQLIHAQDRYFDLSSRQSSSVVDSPKSVKTGKVRSLTNNFEVRSAPGSAKGRTVKIVERAGSVNSGRDEAFKVLATETALRGVRELEPAPLSAPAPAHAALPALSTSKRKKETSFAIIAEAAVSRPSSPRSLPPESRAGRVSPFKGRGFREETSRHTTPKTSAANSRASSPLRRRTSSLSKIDKMATATLPPPIHTLSRPNSPRNFLKENIEEVRELSELNREKHEAEAEQKRQEEEVALLKEMGLLDKNANTEAIRSIVGSRTTSRSNSPSKIKLRSRSNSPAAILHFENIAAGSKEFINQDDGMTKPVAHRSRLRSVSKSQPQSNNGSPKHSKIPKRQNSVSPPRTTRRETSNSRKPVENNLNRNQRFISNSTSSIHETIKVGSQAHDKRALSKSTQHLSISPTLIKGKPPISPGRGGPPPSNRTINAKRLSPIVGTPNKSPVEDLKPSSAKTPTKLAPPTKKPVKTAGNTPATTRLNSRQPSRTISRDTSPDKRKTAAKTSTSSKINNKTNQKPLNRIPSTKTVQKPNVPSKVEHKKPINRTNSMKSLTRTPSTKTLNEKPPLLKKRDSKKDLRSQSTSKINELGTKKDTADKKDDKKGLKNPEKGKGTSNNDTAKNEVAEENKKKTANSSTESDEVTTQDNETQYDTITNDKGELVIMTKKNVVSMTTAAITAQPLEVVTTVTNQLPAAFEKARERGIFERLSSKDSLGPKNEEKDTAKQTTEEKEKNEEQKAAKPAKHEKSTILNEDNVKLKPLQPPYNNPQVERVKQKIDDILKTPEVSTENILSSPTPVPQGKENKNKFKSLATKTKNDIKEAKDEVATKLTDLKNQVVKQNEKVATDFRAEATKIVDSIITPVEEPKDIKEAKEETKKNIEPIIMVVNEKKNGPNKAEVVEKINETLVKGEPEVEVQSSNVSTPGVEKMAVQNKMTDGNGSDKSAQSNGGFPQSTSTTPKPPTRSHRKKDSEDDKPNENKEPETDQSEKKPNICRRIIGKCKTKCCSCCVKGEEDEKEMGDVEAPVEGKSGVLSKFRCCKKKNVEEQVKDVESAAGKVSTIEFESETKRKRKIRDVLCGCCGRRRRVSDVSDSDVRQHVAELSHDATPPVVGDAGCCGKKKREVERRDSILSDQPPNTCCNNRLCNWMLCRRPQPVSSRRPSVFSKNKSLSPTAAPEDNRPKLDSSLVEHTSVMRGAIPVLPISLAYFCLFCNIIVPGLGTILSGIFCLCFGIPRFGVHDGAKHRIGSFVINLVVGCGQLFTVLFCLVGWGWSIWWGVIMVKIARKYRKLRAEAAAAAEEEAAPPVTANNHSRA